MLAFIRDVSIPIEVLGNCFKVWLLILSGPGAFFEDMSFFTFLQLR